MRFTYDTKTGTLTMTTESATETRQTILRDLLLPVVVSLIISAAGTALMVYVNQQRFGDRLDRAEEDIARNRLEQSQAIDKLNDRLSQMSVDVSWIRGRLENKP